MPARERDSPLIEITRSACVEMARPDESISPTPFYSAGLVWRNYWTPNTRANGCLRPIRPFPNGADFAEVESS